MSMEFCYEWDASKAAGNLRKHGISFEQATQVFSDHRALSLFDEEHSSNEDRWLTIGLSFTKGLLVVHHTFDEVAESVVRIRIISSRKATKRESRQYSERNKP